MRFWFALVPMMLLAACSSGQGNSADTSAPAAKVAAVAPPAGKQWSQVVRKTDEGVVMGNPDAKIKLVEYGSRTCPVCGNFARTGEALLKQNYVDTGKVSYEYRDFLVHSPDLGVAALGHCVSTEAYFPLLEQMYANQPQFLDKLENPPEAFQQKVQSMTPAQAAQAWVDYLGYVDFVKQRGVSAQQAHACLTDQKLLKQLSDQTQNALSNMNVPGTPTFFINGNQVPNTVTWDRLKAALDRAGA